MTQAVLPLPDALEYLSPVGFGNDCKEIEQQLYKATAHFHFPLTAHRRDIFQQFQKFAFAWKEERGPTSSVTEMVLLASYQRIIGLGPSVVPFILGELEKEPDHWFWALRAITGENPVNPEDKGRVKKMAEAWIAWGKMHRII